MHSVVNSFVVGAIILGWIVCCVVVYLYFLAEDLQLHYNFIFI